MRRVDWAPGVPSSGPSVAAVGVFDGVHVGHQALLLDAVALARSEGVSAVVLTFEPDPEAVLRPAGPPPRILSAHDRAECIAALGVDVLVVVPFDSEVAGMTADAFIDTVVEPAVGPIAIVVGEDFRFGREAGGDVATLASHGERHGYRVVPHELAVVDGAPVTATRIRRLVRDGNVVGAARLLGRPHHLCGTVEPGHGRGLGIPTANVQFPPSMLVPGDGVYAAWARIAGQESLPAAVSVGQPPTFSTHDAEDTLVEAHLLDVDRTFYGELLDLAFVERLHAHRRFDDVATLADAIRADVDRVRGLLAR